VLSEAALNDHVGRISNPSPDRRIGNPFYKERRIGNPFYLFQLEALFVRRPFCSASASSMAKQLRKLFWAVLLWSSGEVVIEMSDGGVC